MSLKQGWRLPSNSRKAHYYRDGEIISLCGRWMFAGESEDNNHDSPSNCAACKKARERIERGKEKP